MSPLKRRTIEGPNTLWLLIVLFLVLLAFSVSVFGQKEIANNKNNVGDKLLSTETHQPRVYTVSYRAGVFSPTNLRIHAGDTVRFKNEGFWGIRIASDPHPLHNDLAGFDSIGDVPQNSYFSYTFSDKGIFGYHNERNIEEGGTIIVK